MGSKRQRSFTPLLNAWAVQHIALSSASKRRNTIKGPLWASSLLIAVALASVAHAGSATFVRFKSSIVTRGSQVADLQATWKETGLIPDSTNQYQFDAAASAIFICEAGGSVASGPTAVSGTVASVFLSSVSSTGSVFQSRCLDEINGPTCGSGATRRLVSVEYDSAEICDLSNGVCQSLGESYAKTFCDPSKPTACPAT
jgi:hypothetical protein